MMDWPRSTLPTLQKREFIVSVKGSDPCLLKTASHLADDTNAMTDAEWAAVLEAQFAKYYRRVESAGTTPSAEHLPSPALPSKPTWKRQR